MSDRIEEIVEKQIGRKPLAAFRVAVNCELGFPAVIENEPVTGDGRFFPTIFWLSCPWKVREISRLESSGYIKELQQELGFSWDTAAKCDYMERIYKITEKLFDTEYVEKSVGDMKGIKCLHMHYAYYMATGFSEAGKRVAEKVGGFTGCPTPCMKGES